MWHHGRRHLLVVAGVFKQGSGASQTTYVKLMDPGGRTRMVVCRTLSTGERNSFGKLLDIK